MEIVITLFESDHNIRSTKNFIQNIKKENILTGYKMVFFNVKSLFTNNPLDQTIAVILKRIYDGDELRSHLQEMK